MCCMAASAWRSLERCWAAPRPGHCWTGSSALAVRGVYSDLLLSYIRQIFSQIREAYYIESIIFMNINLLLFP